MFLRRVIRWALTALLLAVLSLTIASEWYELGWRHGRAGGRRGLEDHIWIGTGALRGARHDWGRRPPPPSGFYIERYQPRSFWSGPPTFCWFDASFDGPGGFSLGPGFRIPLVPAVLALAVPTGWLWWGQLRRRRLDGRERRGGAGCCRTCGYDLRGLEHAKRCPECGEAPASPATPAAKEP